MPVVIDRKITAKTKDGSVVELEANSVLDTDTTVTIVCAGPRCAVRHDTENPVTITFNEEQVKKDANALPDEYARLLQLVITPFSPEQLPFCGPSCLRDYLQYAYVEPKSPRELAQQLAKQAKDEPKQLELPFTPEAVIGGTAKIIPAGPNCS